MHLTRRLKREFVTCLLQALPLTLISIGLVLIWMGSF